jgi:hypothetical protein
MTPDRGNFNCLSPAWLPGLVKVAKLLHLFGTMEPRISEEFAVVLVKF